MNKETLHKLRWIIPGVIFCFFLVFLVKEPKEFLEFKLTADGVYYICVVIPVAFFYYMINPRMWLMKKPLKRITENIKDKLLAPFSDNDEVIKATDFLREGDKLINVFYFLIDNDRSLTERAKEVYFNGLIWSSLADFTLISPFASLAFFIKYLYTDNPDFLISSGFILALFIISVLLLPKVVQKHIFFSNYQLSYITENLYKKLDEQIKSLLKKRAP